MYVPYQPLSKKGDESTFVPQDLLDAQQKGIHAIPNEVVKNWDDWVAKQLQMDKELLFEVFSSEQIDAIGINIFKYLSGTGFIVADETGVGKGRILSGICRWAFVNNKKVLFFTEREHLLTDFWRDLSDTHTIDLIKNPIILHPQAAIFHQETNEILLKGNSKQINEIFKHGFDEETNIVLTNYSQVSLKQHKALKLNVLKDYATNNVIILDESHNATGDSNTNAFLDELLEVTKNVTFSSATHMKDVSQLALYAKVMDFDKKTLDMLSLVLEGEQNLMLRKQFTFELTRKLYLLRREHEPIKEGWQHILIELTDEDKGLVDSFSHIINQSFEIVQALNSDPQLSDLNIPNHWFSMGATINRLSRNLLLILKARNIAHLIVENTTSQDRKAVIVIDSTFASIINDSIEYQTKVLHKEHYELSFTYVMQFILYRIIGEFIEKNQSKIDKGILLAYEHLIFATQQFSGVDISLIDNIKRDLEQHGVRTLEISGRTHYVNQEGVLEKRENTPRPVIIKEFNDGLADVIIITRAGASGTSLHSSSTFKDQRVRDLYELEITTRPNYRVQFIGRVNRKNQVHKPRFLAVTTDLPFEQRILNSEQQKLETMQAHTSGDENKLKQVNIYPFYTAFCNQCAFIYLRTHPEIAYQLGLSLKGDRDELYYIDGILKRSIILESHVQEEIFNYLIYSTQVESLLNENILELKDSYIKGIKTFWSGMTEEETKKFNKRYSLQPNRAIQQFDYKWVGLASVQHTKTINSSFVEQLKKRFKKNQAKELSHIYSSLTDHYRRRKDLDPIFVRSNIIPRLQSIKIGTQIQINSQIGLIAGLVYDVLYPDIKDFSNFPNLVLLHIKTINPALHKGNHYYKEDFYITLEDILLSSDVKTHNAYINWQLYGRPKNNIVRDTYYWVGHPIYVEFMRQAYGVGEIKNLDYQNKDTFAVQLPSNIDIKELFYSKRPMIEPKEIVDAIFQRKLDLISTSWRKNDHNNKAALLLERNKKGYTLCIAEELFADESFMDYPLKKALHTPQGSANGYRRYIFLFKEIFKILFALKKRGVIWFV